MNNIFSLREKSIIYWRNRIPDKRKFLIFLICIKKHVEIPTISKDIKILLFNYFVRFLPFHLCIGKNPRQIDLVNNQFVILPKNSLQCVHLSACPKGKGTTIIRSVFWIKCKNLANKIKKIENSMINSVNNNRMYQFRNSVVKSESNGFTFFYNFKICNSYTVNGKFLEQCTYTNIFKCPFSDSNNDFYHRIPDDKKIILEVGKFVDKSLILKIKGISNNKHVRTSKIICRLYFNDC